jgi:hypothetical protein
MLVPVNYQELLQTTLDQGLTLERALDFLRGSGASPIEAAQAVAAVRGIPLEEARVLVAQSRAWSAPRSGQQVQPVAREWFGAIGQHGRSGHGASSVLAHLVRTAPASRGGSGGSATR